MSEDWTVADLLRSFAQESGHPAIVLCGETGRSIWSRVALAQEVETFARGLRRRGVRRAQPLALWAPNSPQWIIAALGTMLAGAVLVALDDLSDAGQVKAALQASGATVLITTADHLATAGEMLCAEGVTGIQLPGTISDERDRETSDGDTLPAPDADDPAMFCWTSGTTGAAKGFLLTWRNIGSNVQALCALHIVGPNDRVLQPLPMHHAYPFVVGTLTVLATGAAMVLPAGTSGPMIARALQEGDVTIIIGVPRLYEAMLAAITARVAGRGGITLTLWRALLWFAIVTDRHIGRNPGHLLFRPVRRSVASHLRYLVSGGARLEKTVEEQLNALGWTVLVGYGLAETASLFTGNPPQARRVGSAGRPLARGEIRIADPDDSGIGEIELRGPAVTAGYVNDPEANQTSFAPDGWFRTGDLGFVDHDGFLHVTGRRKEILVLGGGTKVDPEELERSYGRAPQIHEIAVLEDQGSLVALVYPDTKRIRELGTLNLREGVRVVLAQAARELPQWQRLSGFALTDQPLPRTRLGKYRRFLLPALYRQARSQGARRPARPLGPDDQILLSDPTAAAVWALLQEHYPGQVTDPDISLSLDLNIDSFGWMELGVALQERCAVYLTEEDIAAVDTVRDLLRRCIALHQGKPATATAHADADAYLMPTGMALTLLGIVLYALNWLTMRLLFRLRVSGAGFVPTTGGFVITPNHASYLDPFVLAAALPLSRLRRTWWAGTAGLLFSRGPRRVFSRAAHVFPVDEGRTDAAIAACVHVLTAGGAAVWFPEGWRSPDGEVQRFLPGIGRVVMQTGAPVIPAYIGGTFAAWPRGRRLPRPTRVTVTFGQAQPAEALRAAGTGTTEEERIARALRRKVLALAPELPA